MTVQNISYHQCIFKGGKGNQSIKPSRPVPILECMGDRGPQAAAKEKINKCII